MDDLLAEFLTETNESLADLDLALVKLERTPDDATTLSLIFRLVHTIKGTCGFLGLPRLELGHESPDGSLVPGELLLVAKSFVHALRGMSLLGRGRLVRFHPLLDQRSEPVHHRARPRPAHSITWRAVMHHRLGHRFARVTQLLGRVALTTAVQ